MSYGATALFRVVCMPTVRKPVRAYAVGFLSAGSELIDNSCAGK